MSAVPGTLQRPSAPLFTHEHLGLLLGGTEACPSPRSWAACGAPATHGRDQHFSFLTRVSGVWGQKRCWARGWSSDRRAPRGPGLSAEWHFTCAEVAAEEPRPASPGHSGLLLEHAVTHAPKHCQDQSRNSLKSNDETFLQIPAGRVPETLRSGGFTRVPATRERPVPPAGTPPAPRPRRQSAPDSPRRQSVSPLAGGEGSITGRLGASAR